MKRVAIISVWVVAILVFIAANIFYVEEFARNVDPRGVGPPDLASRDSAVATIMKALHENNEDLFASLAYPDHPDANEQARKALGLWAYVSDENYSTSYTSDISPYITRVDIKTVDKENNPVQLRFNLQWQRGAWRLNYFFTPSDAFFPSPSTPVSTDPTPVPAQPPIGAQ